MGNRLVWSERFNLGVELIDNEHQKLFRILNKLFALRRQEEKSRWVCQEAVKYFKEHTLQHFADEEAYMASIAYAGLETHRHIHNNFRERTLPALEKELDLNHYSEHSINHFLGVCAGWLVGHTLIEDHMIVRGETMKQWEQLLPEEEQAVMEQTIASLLYQMFQLEAGLISDCYGGERFGDDIYYRLIYSTKEKKRREFFLIFEEQLLTYEVLTAASGLSTIRGITLDRPDLILLDYEMPVCSGNQVLEMIRAEKEFADIPVIFLTSRMDRESVKKAIALKPEGYLSKSLPPALVKQEVDRFFEKQKAAKP